MIDKGLYKKAPAAKSQLVYESDKRLGYRGAGEYQGGRGYGGSKSSSGGGSKSSGGGGGGGGGNNRGGGADFSTVKSLPPTMTTLPSNIPTSDNKTRTVSTDPMDIREQYRIGNPAFNTPLNAPFSPVTPMVSFDNPYSSLGLEQQRYDNFVDARNLANMEYPGVTGKVPAFIPYSGAINTGINFLSSIIGKPGFEKNTEFFAENVAGKYGYGYGYEDYKQYMKDRMAGNVNAYGRTLTDAERGGNDNNIGIASIQPIIPLTEDQEPEEETPMTDYERYQSYLQNFFGGI